jgi:hypothetical protein
MAHTEPAAIGLHSHWFDGDPAGLTVQPGDTLFANVWVPPGQEPDTIMLQWHDGEGWEHGATWGRNQIKEGKLHSDSRRQRGPLPAAGAWHRLEAPASLLGLEGKTIRGMAFKLHGGQCYFGPSGAVRTEEPTFFVTRTFAMQRTSDGRWTGKFPLDGTGLYRVELRNPQGHANKPIPEAKYLSSSDAPP